MRETSSKADSHAFSYVFARCRYTLLAGSLQEYFLSGLMFKEGDVLCSKYQLKRQFNKGGFSSVWLAYDLKAQEYFALKIYDADGGYSEEEIEEFRRGFKLVVNLTHSNIFKPLSYDVQDNIPFLVMSYCPDGSTTSRIGKMTEDEVWRFAHDVASGLAYLHDYKEVVHQDIKPGNILIDEDGKFMITDFDISTKQQKTVRMTIKQAQEMQDYNYGSGTPDYMGPERWPGDGYIPSAKPVYASDIWSLGATLFELMTGSVPFGETGGAYERKFHAIPKITGHYSKELKKLVRMCLAENTWERPNAKQIAESALSRKAPSMRPFQWKGYLGVVCLIIVILFSTYVFWPIRPSQPFGANDSIFIAQVKEASMMVESQAENPHRYDDFATNYSNSLSKAALMYQETLALDSVSDSIREKGREMWMASQTIIDQEYQYFSSQEKKYAELDDDERPAAADSFALRCEEIKLYVSDNLK